MEHEDMLLDGDNYGMKQQPQDQVQEQQVDAENQPLPKDYNHANDARVYKTSMCLFFG